MNTMTDTDVFICLVFFAVTVIPMSLWCVVAMSREIDTVIKRCETMKRWARLHFKGGTETSKRGAENDH
ncbi:MAG: hypothetical protein IKF39_02155 [Oscillospiraceae bacterium]|nr:hypothetical protein [Oscillospiraceae bacterium]